MNKDQFKQSTTGKIHMDMNSLETLLAFLPDNEDMSDYQVGVASSWLCETLWKKDALNYADGLVIIVSWVMSTRDYSIQRLGTERTNILFPPK